MRRAIAFFLVAAATSAACGQDSTPPAKDPAPAADGAAKEPAKDTPKDEPTPAAPGAQMPAAPGAQTPAVPKTDGVPSDPAAKSGEKENWVKTASGLEYQILTPGKPGAAPKEGDTVTVSYKGWREDGFVFDASDRHGGPASFPVGGLIEGWNEALKMMTVGAKWKLRIPSNLGYGPQGMGTDIPPNATLLFELELHSVAAIPVFVKPDAAAQKATPSGLKYEVLAAGDGEPPTAEDAMELGFAFFGPTGKLVDCSQRSKTIKARPKDMRLPFLKEGPTLMKPGAKFRFEVPPALAFGDKAMGPELPANSITYWELELVKVVKPLKLPDFVKPEDMKLETTTSGLQILNVKDGAGESPKMGQTVRVHYAGWTTGGTVFDSSFSRGDTAEFKIGEVIPGWNEGLQRMKPGGVCRFVIPPKLAYGDRGAGELIPPDATLVFYVELISVEK
ncbi:MAG: FKBP-type peptidyl-prolyl cis-trans isomerase [Planctomycetes bacterium]|nr:FKBP-type peptidyl-prolyl cis-trans isomerase [Planctomycetota bacterium]